MIRLCVCIFRSVCASTLTCVCLSPTYLSLSRSRIRSHTHALVRLHLPHLPFCSLYPSPVLSVVWQWMACGQSGVSGPPVGQSAPTGGGENAAPRHPKTGGRTVRAWCSSPRTAPMGCACRVSTRLILCYSL